MYPLHQSYIRRLTTQPILRLIDTVSWCPTPELVNQNDSTNEFYVEDSFRSHKCEYSIGNIEGDDEDIENTEDDNITLWDLRKNLERNIVAFRSDKHETYCFTNGCSVPASKKPKKLKDIKDYRGWFGCNVHDSTSDNCYNEADRAHPLESKTALLQLKETPDFDVNNRSISPGRLSQTVADVDIRSGNVFDSSSSSVTPDSLSSESTQAQSNQQLDEHSILDVTSETSITRSPADENSSFPRRHFRRSAARRHHTTTSYYGYSLERDFCVDSSTDRVFKEFITSNPMVRESKRGTLQRTKATQLRRQLMRKQYSDTAAVYYGQRMRRWRMQKQRSDSVNCPVDRGVLRRQGRIQEEFFCDEMAKDQQ